MLERDPKASGAHYGLAFLYCTRVKARGSGGHLKAFLESPPTGPEVDRHVVHARRRSRNSRPRGSRGVMFLMADYRGRNAWSAPDLSFGGRGGRARLAAGRERPVRPSPGAGSDASMAGCTAADMVDILAKTRVPLEGLEVVAEGDRAADPPRRLPRVRLGYQTRCKCPRAIAQKVRRAVALSHERLL